MIVQRKCACGGECSTCAGKSPERLYPVQTKLTVNAPGDAFEQEADRFAEKVMGMPEPSAGPIPTASNAVHGMQWKGSCGGTCENCQPERQASEPLQLKHDGTRSVSALPPVAVQQALRSQGQLIEPATRVFMEQRFGHDFSSVRLHNDEHADEVARLLHAHAFTSGDHIAFRREAYSSSSPQGRALLAHELTHVVQQRNAGNAPRIQRFAASETSEIAPTYSDLLRYFRKLIDDASTSSWLGDTLNMSKFVKSAGGRDAWRQIGQKLNSFDPKRNPLSPRYLFTCRCGLIDMLHFIQMFYISSFVSGFEGTTEAGANRYATNKGRGHELEAESASRFGAEDTPSNALGALSGTGLAATPGPDAVYDATKDTLDRCSPIDWSSLSNRSQNTIVHFYSDMIPDPAPRTPKDKVIPKNQEQTAIPVILNLPECGRIERSVPFRIDTSDSDRKTFAGRDFLAGSPGIKKGKEVRGFVNTQRPEIIRDLPLSEKIRLLNILLDPPVDDDDLAAARVIYNNSTSAEIVAEPPTGK